MKIAWTVHIDYKLFPHQQAALFALSSSPELLSFRAMPPNAPQYAPLRTELTQQAEHRKSRLVSCPVADLRPHPSYVRHGLSVDASRLSALAEHGDLAFCDPIAIRRNAPIDECCTVSNTNSARKKLSESCCEPIVRLAAWPTSFE